MLLLSFLQLHTKIRASHYLVNIMEVRKRCSLFLPMAILRKLLSNVRACEVMLVAHSTRQSIY